MGQLEKCSNQAWFDFSFVRRISGSSLCSYIRIFSRHFPDTFATGEQNRNDLDNSTIEPLDADYTSEINCAESDTVTQGVQGLHKGVDEASNAFRENGVHSTKKVRWSCDFCTDVDEPMETFKSEADNTDALDDDFDHGEHDIDFSRITSFYSAFSVLDYSGVFPVDTVEQATFRVNDTFKSHRASIGDQFEGKPPIDSDNTNASVCIDGNKGFGSVELSDVDESGYFTETNFTTTPSFCLKSENPSKERTDKLFVTDANTEQTAETVDVTNSTKLRNDFADREIHFGKSLQTKNNFSNRQQRKADSRSTSTTIPIRKPRSGIKNDIHHDLIADNGNSKMLTKSVRISSDLSDSRMSERSIQDKIRSLFQREHPLEVLFRQRKKVSQMNRRKRKPSLLSLLNCASGRL